MQYLNLFIFFSFILLSPCLKKKTENTPLPLFLLQLGFQHPSSPAVHCAKRGGELRRRGHDVDPVTWAVRRMRGD
ncbi:hypothetical protein ES319_A09G180900v1 [Gossypium barbadense]|uniref:Secreted protein n=2 Tax=Gossypium TaxID=3633 RepID=A0A5J5UGY3_GOSBA|nr:hypothetical protein ES319_A09G180900v1 [Gossypium barbadense]TYH03222.1 hypothetical protein ES288_A09G203900v1 [Gossypium darwinii]